MSNYDPETMIPVLQGVALELTNHCNLSCEICWSQNPHLYPPREKGFMNPDLFRSIIDQLGEYYEQNHRRIFLSMDYGGESLLHPSFNELLAYAGDTRCFKIQLITNGLLMREHVGILKRYGVLVIVSYHDLPQDLKKQVDRNINLLITRRGLNRTNIAVVDAEALGLFKEAKAKFGPMVTNYPLISEDLKYLEGKRDNKPFCVSPFSYMAVLWNGDTWPCCRLLSSDFPSLGNLNKLTVDEVWDGEPYRNLRMDIPERDNPHKPCISNVSYPCQTCELW